MAFRRWRARNFQTISSSANREGNASRHQGGLKCEPPKTLSNITARCYTGRFQGGHQLKKTLKKCTVWRPCADQGRVAAATHWEMFSKSFKSERIQIVFTIFRLIWVQTAVCLVPNHSENGNYNLISGSFNEISKIFLCVRSGKQICVSFQIHWNEIVMTIILFFRTKMVPFGSKTKCK